MKTVFFGLLAAFVTAIFGGGNMPTSNANKDLVNPIIGNQSYLEAFGTQPDANSDNQTRVFTHLKYAENLLRSRDVSHLSAEKQQRRTQLLNLLRDYYTAGKFPKNKDYPSERRPRFIDDEGTICAVGYLVEKTAGLKTAQAINAKHQYDAIMDMDMPELDAWIAQSGLTREECAIIQPTYKRVVPVTGKTLWISGANMTFNGAMIGLNASEIGRGSASKLFPSIGLATGAWQFTYGATSYRKSQASSFYYNDYTQVNIVAFTNMGVGLLTMGVSAFNFFHSPSKKDKHISLRSYEMGNGVGLSFQTRF